MQLVKNSFKMYCLTFFLLLYIFCLIEYFKRNQEYLTKDIFFIFISFFYFLQAMSMEWRRFVLNSGGCDSQQPVHSNQEADVLSGQPHCCEDQKHGHKSCTGDTGCSNTGQGGCHTNQETHSNNLTLLAYVNKKRFLATNSSN